MAVAANRLLAIQNGRGSLAVFPPPHSFFWVREIPLNLGYNWYRKDSASSYSIGIRQAESEADPAFGGHGAEDTRQNFALYNARPGTWQRMPMYLLVGVGTAKAGVDAALAYTRNDHYKPLPGYLVMARHFHTSPVSRLLGSGALDNVLDDFQLARIGRRQRLRAGWRRRHRADRHDPDRTSAACGRRGSTTAARPRTRG